MYLTVTTIFSTSHILYYYNVVSLIAVTGGRHELVPQNVYTEAEKFAKVTVYHNISSECHINFSVFLYGPTP